VKALRHREAEYATTLEEDEKLFQAANLPRRTAMAIQVRHGEKRVLRQAIEEAMKFEASDKRIRQIRGSALNTAKNGSNLNKKRCRNRPKRDDIDEILKKILGTSHPETRWPGI
jgi:hypothetical protein